MTAEPWGGTIREGAPALEQATAYRSWLTAHQGSDPRIRPWMVKEADEFIADAVRKCGRGPQREAGQ